MAIESNARAPTRPAVTAGGSRLVRTESAPAPTTENGAEQGGQQTEGRHQPRAPSSVRSRVEERSGDAHGEVDGKLLGVEQQGEQQHGHHVDQRRSGSQHERRLQRSGPAGSGPEVPTGQPEGQQDPTGAGGPQPQAIDRAVQREEDGQRRPQAGAPVDPDSRKHLNEDHHHAEGVLRGKPDSQRRQTDADGRKPGGGEPRWQTRG